MRKSSVISRAAKWSKLKVYQFEVTFGLLILEPIEKLAVYAVLIALTSLFMIRGVACIPALIIHGIAKTEYYLTE
ncbi:hypothetical protein BJ741DRAFT_598020 [Chytriomyces cf. hyalinus JEL632]|nr:hypothetical protein BJ741DRAFT_598020 [Chytriomyces cf. hyalinus JEL632]